MEGPFVFKARIWSAVQPGLRPGQQASQQPLSDYQGDTMHPTGDLQLGCLSLDPQTAPTTLWPLTLSKSDILSS